MKGRRIEEIKNFGNEGGMIECLGDGFLSHLVLGLERISVCSLVLHLVKGRTFLLFVCGHFYRMLHLV